MIHPEISMMAAREKHRQVRAVADRRRLARQVRSAARAVGSARPVASRYSRAGPRAALYSAEFFQLEVGDVTAYVPVTGELRGTGRVRILEIPAAELAVAVHRGSLVNLDETYGALGTYVAEREIGVAGAIREHYVVTEFDTDDESDQVTEVCWPVLHTATGPS